MTDIRMTTRDNGLVIGVSAAHDQPATLMVRAHEDDALSASGQPLVEIIAAGYGSEWPGPRYVESQIGRRLRYAEHTIERDGDWQTFAVVQRDEATNLCVTSVLQVHDDCMAVRSTTRVRNEGTTGLVLQAVSSLVFGDFRIETTDAIDGFTLLRGRNDWLAEARWQKQPLRAAGLPELRFPARGFRSRGCIGATSVSSWSTVEELPAAVLCDEAAMAQAPTGTLTIKPANR